MRGWDLENNTNKKGEEKKITRGHRDGMTSPSEWAVCCYLWVTAFIISGVVTKPPRNRNNCKRQGFSVLLESVSLTRKATHQAC